MNISEILKILFWILVVSGIVFAFTKSLKRLFQVTSGLVILEVYNSVFDIGVWPVIQGLFGVHGVVGLTLVAMIMNFGVLYWYQKTCKTDWLGISVVHDIVAKSQQVRAIKKEHKGFKKLYFWFYEQALHVAEKTIKGKWIPVLFLTLFVDSFMATAYYINLKHQTVNVKLTKEDYVVFFLSTIIGCVGWSLFTEWITLPAFQSLWQTFAG